MYVDKMQRVSINGVSYEYTSEKYNELTIFGRGAFEHAIRLLKGKEAVVLTFPNEVTYPVIFYNVVTEIKVWSLDVTIKFRNYRPIRIS